MKLKYNLTVNDSVLNNFLKRFINQTYKLLPMRQQGKDWEKLLQTLIQQLVGMKRLIAKDEDDFFLILCKMEGLLTLTEEKDMKLFRKTIFECLSLLSSLNKKCLS